MLWVLTERIDCLIERLDRLEAGFLTRREFAPVQRVVYGGVALVLTAAIAAMLREVLL
jgi:hypothetical protein